MIAAILCGLAFLAGLACGAHSLARGLCAVLTVAYAYGIARANFPQAASHFIFDAAVLGVYLTQLLRPLGAAERRRAGPMLGWLVLLIGWPICVFFIPLQHPLVQLVGLRGNMFLLPFLLFGARLTREDACKLAVWMAVLNLGAFAVAVAEFVVGVERFFPRNEVTRLLYMSRDVLGYRAFRIPSTFTGPHAYGGTMVATVPWLIGAWTTGRARGWQRFLFPAALAASVLGVFMSASRMSAAMLGVLLLSLLLTRRLPLKYWLALGVLGAGVGYLVSTQARLQRFTELKDTEAVLVRIHGSVNATLVEVILTYPMGNGLASGGTSVPHFLQQYLHDAAPMENEYSRITMEQGVPGLLLWVAFIAWVLTRPTVHRTEEWGVGRWLLRVSCAVQFGVGLIGLGMMTAIPGTMLWCLAAGWSSAPQPQSAVDVRGPARRPTQAA